MIREEDIGQLSAVVDKLREFQKTVLLLFYQDEMSIDEISKITESHSKLDYYFLVFKFENVIVSK